MTPTEIHEDAKAWADHNQPPPPDPIQAGLAGGVVLAIGVMLYKAFAGINKDDTAAVLVAFVGFIVPFAYCKWRERKNFHAYFERSQYLRSMNDERVPKPPSSSVSRALR